MKPSLRRRPFRLLCIACLAVMSLVAAAVVWGGAHQAQAANASGGYFAPYVDVTLSPTFPLTQTAQQTGTKLYTLAFVLDGGGCKAEWGGSIPIDQGFMQADISNLRALGGDVIASFGGEVGTELATSCGSASALQAQYQAVIDTYHLTHIDFDIEGATLGNTAANKLRDQAIIGLERAAQSAGRQLAVSFTLPVAASGLLGDGMQFVQQVVADGVNFHVINIMTMDLGGVEDTANLAINAAIGFYKQLAGFFPGKSSSQLWSMVGMTPMIGLNGSAGEVFTEQNAQTVLAFAQQHNLGELAMWSAGRDQACPGGASVISSMCSGIQQPFDFSKIFNQFNIGGGTTPTPTPTPPPGNLVSNPGFETGTTAGWLCDPNDLVVSSPVHSGTHALQLTSGSGTTGLCVQTISVQPSHTYTLSAFAQGSFVTLGVSGSNSTFTNSGSYTQLTVTFTTGASATFATIFVSGYFSAGNAFADDVVLSGPGGSGSPTPTSTPTAPTNTPTATPTSTPTTSPTATPTPPASGGSLQNPGFETGDLSGWNCESTDTVVSSPVHTGSHALQVTPTSSTIGQCTQTISVQPNHTYTLSAFVQGNFAYLGITGSNSNWTSSASYTLLSVSFTTGASTTSITIFVHGWYSQGNVLVDDVSLQ